MKFHEQYGQSIDQRFTDYHKDHPQVYEWFKTFALQAIDRKKGKTSAKLIVNRIRWEMNFQVIGEDYRINDAYSSRYARLFIKDFPEYTSYLEMRELRS